MATVTPQGGTSVSLLQLTTDSTGKSGQLRLPPGRWWVVLGSTLGMGGGAYEVWLQWGEQKAQIDNVANGGHGTPLPCFPDAFIYVQNAVGVATYFIAVSD